MKNLFKKIGALLVAAVMVLSMCTAVFAEGPTAQIRIKNAGTNARFDYLQVIVPDTQKETGWAFATDAIAGKYKTAFKESDDQTIIKKMIVLESADTKYEGTVQKATTQEIESALEAVLGDTTIMNAENVKKGQTAPITVTSAGVYAIKGTEEGYAYSAMAAYIAFTDYNTATGVPSKLNGKEIEAKKTPTTIEKTSDDDNNVVEIGRQVTYTVTGTVPYLPSTQGRFYKIKDTISGASYNVETEGKHQGELKVIVKLGTYVSEKYVTVTGNSFELDLSELVETNVNANKTITITYGAIVTDTYVGNTVVAGDGQNWDDPKYGSKTEELFTGHISINKTGESNEPLEGAGFKVYKEETKNNETVKKYAKFDNNKLAGWTTNEAEATEITTGVDGTVTISGLDLGTYKFKEVTAPSGYSINTNDESGTIALTAGKEKAESADDIVATNATMSDTKLNSLPSTGGMGTYLFTIIGVVVMAGAAGAFFISRRKGSEE
ncbi:MAG: LPXTG cell wall anchor domain-containing protein [Blautia massiliensis]|uniref:SpaA isopeptide-forming pilin-related protein n=1 Tax=Blautia massiliensis (ex Durand et al. 2017) TaxID=1737424 RepID=UPI00242F2747|nr:SpaA isopeptide-forming pilin-related protein [Blautia massiliensis (ex Durand et al. 2017)]MCI7602877.1 LPXTG cell wall anchor domain-containing protein [Blautia massiliensis (ex Durand et al. 2017)]